MLRIMAIALLIPTVLAAWMGDRIAAAAQNAPAETTTVAGCVARQTEAGIAYTTPARGAAVGVLLLTRMAVPVDIRVRGTGAGTTAATADRGTLGARVAQPSATADSERTYELAGANIAALRDHIGKRVEIMGTLAAAAKQPTAPASSPAPEAAPPNTAHPSASRVHLNVVSFRPVGGACPLG